MKKKALALALSAVMLAVSAFGTVAYLMDTDKNTNTFTVGKVDITLDEAPVDKNGKKTTGDRVHSNEYHLLPGHTYDKDPTVTVKKGSENSYVRILMTVTNASAVQAIINADDDETTGSKGKVEDYSDLFAGWNEQVWKYYDFQTGADNSITFEFRYKGIVNKELCKDADYKLDALFKKIVVPGYVTNAQLAALYGTDTQGDFKIELVAHAIQAAGFTTEDAAWKAFDEQI